MSSCVSKYPGVSTLSSTSFLFNSFPDHLQSIPPSCWARIFSMCSPENRKNIKLTCKLFTAVIDLDEEENRLKQLQEKSTWNKAYWKILIVHREKRIKTTRVKIVESPKLFMGQSAYNVYRSVAVYRNSLGSIMVSSRSIESYFECQNTSKDLPQKKLILWISRLSNTTSPFPYGKRPRNVGIGTCLIQRAIEESFKRGYEGRVGVSAFFNSHGFYYKLGFRSQEPLINEAVVEALQRSKVIGKPSDTLCLGEVDMFLPREAIDQWKQKIMGAPIVPEVRAYLSQKNAHDRMQIETD